MKERPSYEQLLMLLVQALDLNSELLDFLDANGIAWPVPMRDRLDVLLVEAVEAGLEVRPSPGGAR